LPFWISGIKEAARAIRQVKAIPTSRWGPTNN